MKSFERGDKVRVMEGVFAHFPGVVTDVSADHKRLKVAVTFVGKSNAVELDIAHVEEAG
jgi:transcription termination/antitermination protein NusG